MHPLEHTHHPGHTCIFFPCCWNILKVFIKPNTPRFFANHRGRAMSSTSATGLTLDTPTQTHRVYLYIFACARHHLHGSILVMMMMLLFDYILCSPFSCCSSFSFVLFSWSSSSSFCETNTHTRTQFITIMIHRTDSTRLGFRETWELIHFSSSSSSSSSSLLRVFAKPTSTKVNFCLLPFPSSNDMTRMEFFEQCRWCLNNNNYLNKNNDYLWKESENMLHSQRIGESL